MSKVKIISDKISKYSAKDDIEEVSSKVFKIMMRLFLPFPSLFFFSLPTQFVPGGAHIWRGGDEKVINENELVF